jgi:hypothetical protein
LFKENGRTVNFVESGEGTVVVVLFVPGSFSMRAAWLRLQNRSAQGYRFISTRICDYNSTEETPSLDAHEMPQQTEVIEAVMVVGKCQQRQASQRHLKG